MQMNHLFDVRILCEYNVYIYSDQYKVFINGIRISENFPIFHEFFMIFNM